jgi:hypothetical protein
MPDGSRRPLRDEGAGDRPELQAHDVSRAGGKVAIDINPRRASFFDARSEKAI